MSLETLGKDFRCARTGLILGKSKGVALIVRRDQEELARMRQQVDEGLCDGSNLEAITRDVEALKFLAIAAEYGQRPDEAQLREDDAQRRREEAQPQVEDGHHTAA